MKIFLTGATGYIGSVIAEKLLENGHQFWGLARSEESAQILNSRTIKVVYGDLDNLEVLTEAAENSDGVVHAGFKHSTAGLAADLSIERKSVHAMIKGLGNKNKPFIYTSGTGMLGDTEDIIVDELTQDRFKSGKGVTSANTEMKMAGHERIATEKHLLKSTGARGIVIRPPNVYGRSNGHALLSFLIDASKEIGAVPYTDFSGDHLWTFVHVQDLADLYVLALEKSAG